MMLKKNIVFPVLFVSSLVAAVLFLSKDGALQNISFGPKNTLARNALQEEARVLKKQGLYERALEKYREAILPKMLTFEWQASTARGAIIEIYCLQGRYDEALEDMKWFVAGNSEKFTPWLNEIKALAEYQASGDAKMVYDHISWLKETKKKFSPPAYADDQTVSTILRLYNTIGAHDAGIKFIDEILAYFRTGKAGDPKPGKVDAEYMKVREAFERDKRDGFKGCAGSLPGQVCMGKATKALIQSDYFPW